MNNLGKRVTALIPTMGLLGLFGCGGPAAGPSGDESNYSVAVAGDLTRNQSGISVAHFTPNGWSEETNGGARKYTSDVTLVLLADPDLTKPQTNLGLLGTAKIGTYRVRSLGAVLGEALEFYGNYRVTNPDGTTTVYDAGTGTVTISEVFPVLRGTFSFHASTATTWPATVTPGTRAWPVAASLDVSGTFVVEMK